MLTPSKKSKEEITEILEGYKLEVYREGLEPMTEELALALDLREASIREECVKIVWGTITRFLDESNHEWHLTDIETKKRIVEALRSSAGKEGA